jgi:hypothetical protein
MWLDRQTTVASADQMDMPMIARAHDNARLLTYVFGVIAMLLVLATGTERISSIVPMAVIAVIVILQVALALFE